MRIAILLALLFTCCPWSPLIAQQHTGSLNLQHQVNNVPTKVYSVNGDVLELEAQGTFNQVNGGPNVVSVKVDVMIYRLGTFPFPPVIVYESDHDAITPPGFGNSDTIDVDCEYPIWNIEPFYHTSATLYYLNIDLDPVIVAGKSNNFRMAEAGGPGNQ